jgi:hypothetical protein
LFLALANGQPLGHLRGIVLAIRELRRGGVSSCNRWQERGEMPAFAEIVLALPSRHQHCL